MYARINYSNGTNILFEIKQFFEHELENEPGRYELFFDRKDKGWETGMNIESEKDLYVYIMNDNGKTIDSRIYCK